MLATHDRLTHVPVRDVDGERMRGRAIVCGRSLVFRVGRVRQRPQPSFALSHGYVFGVCGRYLKRNEGTDKDKFTLRIRDALGNSETCFKQANRFNFHD